LRPYACGVCGLAFGEKSGRAKHIRTVHRKERPFGCSQCPSRFHFKLHALQHQRTVHQRLRPYGCLVCGVTFGQRSSLNRHMRTLHAGAVPPPGGAGATRNVGGESRGGRAGGVRAAEPLSPGSALATDVAASACPTSPVPLAAGVPVATTAVATTPSGLMSPGTSP